LIFLPNSFVPTEFEQKALDELDAYEANLASIQAEWHLDKLMLVLKAVPNYHTIKIPTTCVFKHRLLKKTWAEYAPGHCIASTRPQILPILNAINFTAIARFALTSLENLELKMEETHNLLNQMSSPQEIQSMFYAFLNCPKVRSLNLAIQPSSSIPWDLSILPPPQNFPHLTHLHLSSASFSAQEFLDYLSILSPTLTHIQFHSMRIFGRQDPDPNGEMRWKGFLQEMRKILKLERFLLAGSTWFICGDGVTYDDRWHLIPFCDRDWRVYEKQVGGKSWLLERFVVGGGEWPMTAEDVDKLPPFHL